MSINLTVYRRLLVSSKTQQAKQRWSKRCLFTFEGMDINEDKDRSIS